MLSTFQQNITQRQEKRITKYRAKPVNKHVRGHAIQDQIIFFLIIKITICKKVLRSSVKQLTDPLGHLNLPATRIKSFAINYTGNLYRLDQ